MTMILTTGKRITIIADFIQDIEKIYIRITINQCKAQSNLLKFIVA